MSTPAFSLGDARDAGDVRSPKTAELLTRRLRRMIASGELRDGDFLPREAELMAHFGVSRPTLREALRVLEAESLVEVRRGSRTGARIRVPGPAVVARPAGLLLQLAGTTIAEVLTARLGFEPLAARLVAGRGSAEVVAGLTAALGRVEEDLAAGRPAAASASAFHQAVVEGSGNRALVVVAGMLQEIVARHLAGATSWGQDQPDSDSLQQYRRAVRAYEKLLQLVRAGDADEAERFWRRHLETANSALMWGVEPDAVIDVLE